MTIQETRAVLYADEKLDITLEVIERLDKMLPDLKLPQID
jgi:Skp family chaperone for outer membrane proteins